MKIANEILIPELARLLATGKEVRFTPSGVSMRPFIEGDRDSVILAPLKRANRGWDVGATGGWKFGRRRALFEGRCDWKGGTD